MSHELSDSQAFCSRVARREARNFYPSFLLLPAPRRRSMCALYAFMRHTDDLADADPSAPIASRRAALEGWRADLTDALEGGTIREGWPGWLAFADAVARHGIPARYLHEVIDGVEMDLEPRPIATAAELDRYCYHVASAVGLCCIHIWGFQSDGGRAESLAEATGRALQLTNILRDVGEDARNGRVYLPEDEIRRFGVTPEDLLATTVSPALRRLLAHWASRAYDEYENARALAGLVDPVGRPVLNALVGIYRALLDEIVARDHEVLASRVSVPGRRKATITLRALAGRFFPAASRGLQAQRLP